MSYNVLIVDDESIDLEWLRRRVESYTEKLEVVAAVNSGFKALSILQEQSIQIMMTDIRMPIMTGLELAAKAKELQPRLKIVFISGHDDFAYAKQAIRMNAAAYLLKPVDDTELQELITELSDKLDQEYGREEQDEPMKLPLPLTEEENSSDPSQTRQIVKAIRDYVEEQLENKITLKQVAAHFGFSPNYLGFLFREETGELFSDYLIRAKLVRACRLLHDPLLKIYEISDRIGYKNVLYFNRQFKKFKGMTPSEYRKSKNI